MVRTVGKRGGGKIGAKRVEMEPPVADTKLARRLLEAEGPVVLSMVRTLQVRFGAKAVWYQDGQGEVGKQPGWAQ